MGLNDIPLEWQISLKTNFTNETAKVDDAPQISKVYLNVPFKDKDKAKELNCKWDKEAKKWYTYKNALSNIPQEWQVAG